MKFENFSTLRVIYAYLVNLLNTLMPHHKSRTLFSKHRRSPCHTTSRTTILLHARNRAPAMSNFYSPSQSTNSRSPPPLQHPVPTHPAYIPEPPSTPVSPQGYMRFTSSPPNPNARPQPHRSPPQSQQYPQGRAQPYIAPQFQSFASAPAPGQAQHPTPADFAQWGVNPATAQFGIQLGQSAVAAGQNYVQRNVRCTLACFLVPTHICAVWQSHPSAAPQTSFQRF